MGLYEEIMAEQKKKKKNQETKKAQTLLKEREKQVNLPTYTEKKPVPFQVENRTANNPNNMERVNQRLQNYKNYSKNDEIRQLVAKNGTDRLAKNIRKVVNDSYLKDGYDFGDITGTLFRTTANASTNALHGLGKSLENAYDFMLNASTNVNTSLGERTGVQTKEQAQRERQIAADIIKRDLTTDLENKLGLTEDIKKELEKGSLIKRENLGGKVSQGVGEMLPQILIGNAMGGTPTQWANLSTKGKIAASLPTNLGIGITSYGGGLEEAYNEGALVGQANKYALGAALTEIGTEWISGGVPGLPQTGIIDKWTDETIDKASNSMSKFLLKQGFTFLGEGGEEGLSEIIKPFLQNATYTSGKNVNWKDVFESFVVGGLVGDILELPGNLSTYKADVNAIKSDLSRANSDLNIPNNINILENQNDTQNGLNIPTNNNIKSIEEVVGNTNTTDTIENPLENLQELKIRQQESNNLQVQEETNNRIASLEKQLEEQGNRILEESESQREAMIENFKQYLEENNITNPTQQDINDSITDLMSYDNDLDFADTARAEQLYNQYVKEYMKDNNIPFNIPYRGSHQIENAKRLVDLNINDIQNRVEELNGYLTKQDQIDLRVLHNVFNHPQEDLTVYRASPVNELNNGDWITTDKSYAKNVAQNNGGKVFEYVVKPGELYYPDNIRELPSLHRLSSFQYIGNQNNIPNVENNQNNNYNNIKGSDNDVSRTNENNRTDSLLQDKSNRQNGGYNNSNQEQTDSERNRYVYSPKSYDVGSRTVREVFGEEARTNVDSEGKKLTEDQIDFYANDMVRNADGNLLVVYHGTKEQFDTFDKSKIGSNTHNVGMFGCGFYFTENKALAGNYNWAENVPDNYEPMALYVNITNPFYWNGIKTEEQMNEFVQKIGLEEGILTWNRYAQEIHAIKEEDKAREFSKKLQENGYDGIIYKYDHGQTTSEIVAFEPNQIKSVDNLHPTAESNNIYERTNDSSFSLSTKKEVKETPKKELNLPKNTTKELANKKVEQKVNQQGLEAIKKAANAGKSYLQLKYNEVKTLKNELKEYSGLSKEELTNAKTYNGIKEKVNQFINRQVEYLDEDLKRVKNEIRNTNIKVDSELKEQITDYNDFKKSNFGKLKLSTTGQSIDSIYQELSDQYPYYFDSNITSEADMLYELSDFMNKSNTITEEYKLSDEDVNKAVDKIFNSLIDNSLSNEDINDIQEEIMNKYSKRTRKVVQEELLNEMGITLDDIAIGKDINALGYQRTDPIRLNEKVFGTKVGQKINDATINKTKHNEAERTRFLNKEREEIKKLGIKARSKESAAVQKYGEKQYVNDNGEISKYGDRELASEFPDVNTQEKIKHAAQVLRNKYDNYIEQINNVITELGYDPIPKRPDYMRHFQEINDKLSQWGIPLNPTDLSKDALPTDINGLTDQFKPGKNWFASAMQRKGFKTTYDAITGIDGYLEGASNLIYHTPDIQRYRALSKMIRDTYGQTHGMDNIDPSTEEGQKRLNDIFDNKLSKYAAWLDEQANALAGKKGGIDRAAERLLGRKIYSVLDAAKKQVGSNMTGFNVRSAMTNFASAVQGASKTKKLSFIKGTISTLKNMIRDDGLIDKSDFLTSRLRNDSQLSKKAWQKASNAGQIFMTGTDYFTANQIWRSKYYENLDKGMSESQAIKKADDFAARIMGDRSKGSTAEAFNSKTLGLLTQFQLEVNNQWSSIIHDNKIDIKSGNKSGATVMFQLGQLAALSYLFNNFMKSMTGSDVMIDPIDMLKKIVGDGDDDEEETIEDRAKKVMGDLIDDLPFVSFMTGGRIPMKEAFKGVESLAGYYTGATDSYGNPIKWSDVKKDLAESAFYWLLPTGYGQVKKTKKGLSMYDKNLPIPGSYTDSGNLRFNADTSTGGKVKAALFGQYSSEESQKYIKSGYKSIRKERLEEMKELDMKASEYRKYREDLNKAGTKNSEKIEFIANSDYSDEAKDIMAKNVLKRDFDINEYEKYNSYEEYDYAQKYPEKYSVIKYIAPYDKYNTYKDKIKNIRDNTTNDKAETIKYINDLNMSIPQKAMFIKQYYKSFKSYDKQIIEYINSQKLTRNEKEEILKQLGFTIRNGRVY